jgi:acyl carrier protein
VNLIQENALVASVLTWIREHKLLRNLEATAITEDTDLMANGLLDSMGLIDLLLFVEEQTGRSIDLKVVEPKDICVVKNLCRIALGNNISQSTNGCEHVQPSCGNVLAAGGQV